MPSTSAQTPATEEKPTSQVKENVSSVGSTISGGVSKGKEALNLGKGSPPEESKDLKEVDPEEDVTSKAEDVPSKAGDEVDNITNGEAPQEAGDAVQKTGDTADLEDKPETVINGDIPEKAQDTVEDTKDSANLEEKTEPATDGEIPKEVGDTVEGAKDSANPEENIESAPDSEIPQEVGNTAEDVKESAESEEKPETATEGEVPQEVGDATEDVKDTVESEEKPEGVTEGETPQDVQGAVEDTKDSADTDEKLETDDKLPNEEDIPAGDVAEDLEDKKPELDLSILDGLKVNKLGKVVKEDGTPMGQIVEGDPKKLAGKKVDAEGQIWDDSGKVIGRAEVLADAVEGAETSPFEDFKDAIVSANGDVIFEGRVVGKVTEGDPKKLEGKKIDDDGDILDKNGNVLGKAERYQEEDPEPEAEAEEADLSDLDGKKVNKAGNVVDDHGKQFGRVVTGDLAKLIGRKCDAKGQIYSDSGKVIGTAELVSADDRDEGYSGLFEDFPDATLDAKGNVIFEGQTVGKLVEGDAKKLEGKKVDKDGEVVDKIGNVLGKAERWTEPDEPEAEAIDLSSLAGKRVNKIGNVVDSSGQIYGRIVSGDPKKLAGKMCDKNGNVMNEMGDIIGKAELVPEAEREGEKTGPFADFDSPTVNKEGKVVDARGSIIGRLVGGDAKLLFGKPVDADGDILDKNGNTLGRAERWEEEEKAVSEHPALGRKVNKKGEVVDENGDIIAKLTSGDLSLCAGKEIDNDGDVKDQKGTVVGHISLLEDIPEPEPEPEVEEEPKESEEEIAARKELEQDKKLAGQLAGLVEQSIDKIKPLLKMITETIDVEEKKPKEERDEQKLVDTVKPLLEEGGQILQECNGSIRALDPDGRIQANAKQKSASREATPEEYRLAEQLKELSASVMTTIDAAKKKIAGMPHAKKELNPLWGLLAEPLGQIIAAVGLLLSGVLGLVGRLLSVLGLGGLLDNLLGGLGIKGILQGLGLGTLTKSLTGKK